MNGEIKQPVIEVKNLKKYFKVKNKGSPPPDLYFHLHNVYNEAERGIFLQALLVNILQDIGANVKDCW